MRQAEIPSYNFTVRIYRHKATGAEVLSIITTDVNKVVSLHHLP